MGFYQETLSLRPRDSGTHEFTNAVTQAISNSGMKQGVATVFCQHTSCSLVIMENADPSARRDLEKWLNRLVPGDEAHFEHTQEGPDDMPSHIKMVLTRTSESIPFVDGRLQLGTWQGIFLWEHRNAPLMRHVLVTIMGE